MKPVRIVVVGDAGVGKSSLITAAATESFPEHPPPVLPPTRLAHDTTPEGVPMVLVDTSSRPEDKANLELACRNADVIILCFDSGSHPYHSIVCEGLDGSQQQRIAREEFSKGHMLSQYHVAAGGGVLCLRQAKAGLWAAEVMTAQEEYRVTCCTPCRPSAVTETDQRLMGARAPAHGAGGALPAGRLQERPQAARTDPAASENLAAPCNIVDVPKLSCLRHEQHPALLTCLSALFQDATNAVYQVHALCTAQCIAE